MKYTLISQTVGIVLLLFSTTAVAGEPVLAGYADFDAFRLHLESIAASEFASLQSLGRTRGGRDVYVLRIGAGRLDEKPAILIVGNVDPPHLLGSELAVRVAERLVKQASDDAAVRKLLDRVTFYVIPRPSPDASEAFFRRPYCERIGNDRPRDDDRDGEPDEDPPEDLNADGWITMMRVEDPAGPYMPHPADPRILIKADPSRGEQGRYRLFVEGRDNDEDGRQGEDPPGGVAFNRNFTFRYPYFKPGAGPHQVSEVETRAVADFAFDHPNIAAVLTFTPEDNLMRPWKPDAKAEPKRIKTAVLKADAPYMNHVAEQYRKIHGGKDSPPSPQGRGSFSQWAYFHYGRWSFACRGWWIPKVPPPEEENKKKSVSKEKRAAEELNALRWFAREKIDGFVDWKSVSHGDFPGRKVEVGGWRPFLRLNPPADRLEPLAEKHWQFVRKLAGLLPRLTIERTKVEPLGGGVWRVTVVVLNEGYLPTMSKMGKTTGEPYPLQVRLELPDGVSLVTGHARAQLPPLAGSGGKAEQTWLVRGPRDKTTSLRVRAWSPSVGEATRTIKLAKQKPLAASHAPKTIPAMLVSTAGGKNVYQTMGAPADPKMSARWNRYHDYAASTKFLKALVAAHPQRSRLRSLGRSYGGREMWLLTITNFKTGNDRDKPAFWIDGGIHANEIQGVEVVLYTAWYLLEMAERNPLAKRLLDERTFYLVPMMSPDSRDAHMYRPASTHSPRSGQRPVDDDRDGLVDEDGPDDLDADGNITQMRIRDPNGRWKPHPKYPHLMVRAGADERGGYRMLGVEGFDNDGDGRVNEDSDGYYDPNRDWAWNWQPRYVQFGAYRYPFSILENRMAAAFIMEHPNIAGAQSYHNAGGMILRGPGAKTGRYEPADVKVFDAIARRGRRILPGYRYLTIGKGLYDGNTYGLELDWFYRMQGVFAFTNELFTSKNYFHRSANGDMWDKGTREKRREEAEAFNEHLLFGQGTVPWKEVDHPQFGKVEVGGRKKNWGRQPPSFLLEEECHRNMAFTLYHADEMPKIEVQSVRTKPLGRGLIQVTAVVANPKLTPTRSAHDVKHKITPPDVVEIEGVEIEGKDCEVVLGMWSEDPFFQKVHEQKRRPEKVRIAAVPAMGAVHVRWLVRGKGPWTVTARSVKGGRSVHDVER
jgi:murein tripeptide amidase MpaA